MPVKTINALDVPLLFDVQADFSGGRVSSLPPTSLGVNQVSDMLNMDIDRNGNLRRRRGFHSFGYLGSITDGDTMQGGCFFDTPLIECILAVADGKLYRCDVDGNWTLVASSVVSSTTEPVWLSQVGTYLYLTDGSGRCRAFSDHDISNGSSGTLLTDGPVLSSVLVAHRYRLFTLNGESNDELYVSKFLPSDDSPFTVPGEINRFRVGDGDGDVITAMLPWKGWTILVFKENSVHAVNSEYSTAGDSATTDASSFQISRLSGRVGCRAPRSVAAAGNDVLFLSHDGVRSVARTEADGDGQLSAPLSAPIDDIIERINWSAASKSAGIAWGNRYLLTVPLDGATEPDTTLVFNFKTGAWAVWDGVSVAQWVVTAFNGETQRLVALGADGHALRYRDDVATANLTRETFVDLREDDESDPEYRVISRGFTLGEAEQPKHLRSIEVELYQSTADFALSISIDGAAPIKIDPLTPSASRLLTLPTTLPTQLEGSVTTNVSRMLRSVDRNRYAQVVIESPSSQGISGDLCVRKIHLAGWLKGYGTDHTRTLKTIEDGLPIYAGVLDEATLSASDIESLSRFSGQFDANATVNLTSDTTGYLWVVVPESFSMASFPDNFYIGRFNIAMADTLTGGVTVNGWTYIALTVDGVNFRAYRSQWTTAVTSMRIKLKG